ncbi:DEAD/DEAH box helicase [Shewanella sp. OMA3-2]|uniref:DEAD/DEAH box helicase n=1 Tax=Shewanella sp. OMA3-2 TaxID=2908650 RepID=UPI001F304ACC|nr:DEAD/DEAH box helicase [Shewanella sp. OMA3-2]UJF22661.1 DEAD/DEAH box helicase [Shewanella sp. OMA3-2]
MSFSALSLHPQLLSRLSALKFTQPTAIQAETIPVILAGKDVMAGAQTGTGKTAAFCLPILHQLLTLQDSQIAQINDNQANAQLTATSSANVSLVNTSQARKVKALVLTPTRELAQQVHHNLTQLMADTDIKAALLYGGVSTQAQMSELAAGVDIIVATPGRLLDLLRRRATSLSAVDYFVIDEADRMLDMGFRDEIIEVLKRLPKQRQTLLFSATLDDRIFSFSKRLLTQAKVIETHGRNQTAVTVTERVYNVDADKKCDLLCKLIAVEAWQQVLIFSRTKQDADALVKQMSQRGAKVAALHADLSQLVREQVLTDFKGGQLTALVATDVAARGIDISQLDYVVNMELPFKLEDYVHRIGRTGRTGQAGHAITLFSVDDEPLLIKLEAYLDKRLPQQWYPGFEPDLTQVAPVTRKTKKGSLKQQARQKALAQSKR